MSHSLIFVFLCVCIKLSAVYSVNPAWLTTEDSLALQLRGQMVILGLGVFKNDNTVPAQLSRQIYMSMRMMKMCGKLDAMEKCFDIINNASLETADYYLKNVAPDSLQFDTADLPSVWNYFAEVVEAEVAKDPQLSTYYNEKLGAVKLLPLNNLFQNKTANVELGKKVFAFMLHRKHVQDSYLDYSTVDKLAIRSHVTARTIIELAKRPDRLDAMQNLYDKSIDELLSSSELGFIEALVVAEVELPNMINSLYDEMDAKMRDNPRTREEYYAMRKLVENNSKWRKKFRPVDSIYVKK